jgi:mono/diheme cytochrome c family protein
MSGDALAGGFSEGWHAPALNAASPAPVPWDVQHLFAYLHQGWDAEHGAAAGPMQSVTDDLSRVDERDVRAMATYLDSLQRPISPDRRRHIDELLARATHHEIVPANGHPGNAGAILFAGACANCHVGGPSLVPPRGIDLALSSALSGPDPRNAILITLHGIHPDEGQRGPLMPAFDSAFTDGQLAALLGYVRENYSDQPAWLGTESSPNPLQRAFIEEQAAQCGYCIAGMIMRAQALLERISTPSDAQIRAQMEPNLCRCGTHMRILRAIRRASNAMRSVDAEKTKEARR